MTDTNTYTVVAYVDSRRGGKETVHTVQAASAVDAILMVSGRRSVHMFNSRTAWLPAHPDYRGENAYFQIDAAGRRGFIANVAQA